MAQHDLADGISFVEAPTQELARRIAQFMDNNGMTTEAQVRAAMQQQIDILDNGAATTAQKIAAVSALAKIQREYIMSSIEVKTRT